MQMRSRCTSCMPHIGYNLPCLYLLTHCDTDSGTMRIQRSQSTAMVDFDVIAIASTPTVEGVGDGHGAVGSGQDRGTLGHGDVGAAVVAGFAGKRVGSIALWRGDRTRHRQRPL